jgi:hypothetical protein
MRTVVVVVVVVVVVGCFCEDAVRSFNLHGIEWRDD